MDVAIAIFVCALAIQAMSVRILFSMSRDNNLPFARQLASVHGSRRVPVVPAVVSGLIALLILAFNINNPKAFTIIISMGIILMYIPYWLLNSQVFLRRREGWPDNLHDRHEGLFRLGKWGLLTNGIAVLYGVAMTINLMWPRDEFYGTAWYQQWGPILLVAIVAIAGLIWWFAVQQHRGGVLDEHAAPADQPPPMANSAP